MKPHIIRGMLAGLLVFCLSGEARAQHGHSHGTPAASRETGAKDSAPAKGSAQTATLEGLRVSLEVMSMGEHMKHKTAGATHGEADHSKSHVLMVTLQDTASKEIISDARVSFSVLSPSGKKENGKMEWSGDHYGGGFSPREKGTYQVELKIESGGMERDAKLSYEFK